MNKKDIYAARWKVLGDLTHALSISAPSWSPSRYFQELIIGEADDALVEKRFKILENIVNADKQELFKVKLSALRVSRNEKLRQSDFSQLPDVPLDSSDKKLYRTYRQYLRDLPSKATAENIDMLLVLSFSVWLKFRERHGENQIPLNTFPL